MNTQSWIVLALIIFACGVILYRKFVLKKGGCSDCAACSSCKACKESGYTCPHCK